MIIYRPSNENFSIYILLTENLLVYRLTGESFYSKNDVEFDHKALLQTFAGIVLHHNCILINPILRGFTLPWQRANFDPPPLN